MHHKRHSTATNNHGDLMMLASTASKLSYVTKHNLEVYWSCFCRRIILWEAKTFQSLKLTGSASTSSASMYAQLNMTSVVSQACGCKSSSSVWVRRSGVQSLAVAGVTQQDGFLVASPAQGCRKPARGRGQDCFSHSWSSATSSGQQGLWRGR